MIASIAAIVFAVVTSVVAAFQLALALGVPWGAFAMGGRFPGTFPPLLRLAALVQAVFLVVIALGVLSASTWAVWVAVAVSAVAFVLNMITPSRLERRIWAPAAGVMLISSLAVALT